MVVQDALKQLLSRVGPARELAERRTVLLDLAPDCCCLRQQALEPCTQGTERQEHEMQMMATVMV